MSLLHRPALHQIIPGLLVALLVTNATFLILLRAGGPLIGLAFYLVLLALCLRTRQHNHRLLMIGGLVGVTVHVAEVATVGWSAYPVLMALNLALPAALAVSTWAADRGPRRVAAEQ